MSSGAPGVIGGRLGLGLAAASAASFGVITTLARLSYDGGGSPESVIAARYLAAVLVLGALVALRGKRFGVARASWGPLALMTLGVLGLTVGYLRAVATIPVSLAALIFYSYPLMVAAASPLIERRRPGLVQSATFVLAFGGLALALGPSFDSLAWQGVAWAALAAVSAATIFLSSRPLLAVNDAASVAFQVNLLGGGLVGLMLAAGLALPGGVVLGAVVPPVTQLGWAGLAGASAAYILAMLTQFGALRRTGPLRAAVIFNLEPLVSIALAVILLGERLSGPQLLGVALVLAALMLAVVRGR